MIKYLKNLLVFEFYFSNWPESLWNNEKNDKPKADNLQSPDDLARKFWNGTSEAKWLLENQNNELTNLNESYESAKENIRQETRWQLNEFIKTLENHESSWIRNWEKTKMMEDVNISSLNDLLKNGDINEIYNKVEESIKWKTLLSFFNNWDLQKVLTSLWYQSDWIFGWDEAGAVVNMIRDAKQTQDKFPTMSPTDKMQILLDFDGNWLLNREINFNSWELEAFFAINDSANFETVMRNLWLNDFDRISSKNYIELREKFKERLATFAEIPWMSLNQLLLSQENFKKSVDIVNQIVQDERMQKLAWNPKFKDLHRTISSYGVWVATWAIRWLAVSTNEIWDKSVGEITNWIFDSVSFGYWEWSNVPGFIIWWWKRVNENISTAWWLTNFIPFAAWTAEFGKDEVKMLSEIFPNTKETDYSLAWTVVASWAWIWWWIEAKINDEKTLEWINNMVESAKLSLDKIMDAIISWKNFSEAWLVWWTEVQNLENEKIFNSLKENFNAMWWKPDLKNIFIEWVLNNYKWELARNAERDWWQLTSIWVWLFWPFIIPGIKFEKIITDYVAKESAKIWENITKQIWSMEARSALNENIEKTKNVINIISEKITAEIATSKEVRPLKKSINILLNWWKNLDKAWQDFMNLIPFAKDLPINNFDDNDKRLVLQNVAVNLMKKEWLHIDWDFVKIKDGEVSIKDYDTKLHKRPQFFDRKFWEHFWDILWDIQKARQEYYNRYWNETSYTIWKMWIKDWISFSWVEDWVNPYAVWHIAEFNWEPGKVKIEAKSNNVVDKIPDYMLDSVIEQLAKYWYDFSWKNKYKEIRNIIKRWWDDSLSMEYNLYFAKDPECLNDKIIIDVDIKWDKINIWDWWTYVWEIWQNTIWVAYAIDKTEKPSQNQAEEPEPEKPEEPGKPDKPNPEPPTPTPEPPTPNPTPNQAEVKTTPWYEAKGPNVYNETPTTPKVVKYEQVSNNSSEL